MQHNNKIDKEEDKNQLYDKTVGDVNPNIVVEKKKKTIKKINFTKNKEILLTLVIALVAIVIYFSVGNTKSQTSSAKINVKEKSHIEKVLSDIEGVGECSVVITYISSDKITQSNDLIQGNQIIGVVVVATGGDNVYTKMKISEALIVLLKVSSSQIKIYKSK